jgi:pimeloyl-ACP methyl ester carboxylesterase
MAAITQAWGVSHRPIDRKEAPMQTQQIEVHGAALSYRDSGRGDPMVLVHANLSDMRSWEPIEPLLARHFRVVNYSRRYAHPNLPIGEGVDDTLSQHAEDLISLIEQRRLGRVHLVGNSSGAFICLLVASRRPDLVRSLTLEEPPVVSMFVGSFPPKPLEALKLLLKAPATFVTFVMLGAGTIAPATQAFRDGDDVAGMEIFSRGVLGRAAYAKVSAARRRQMLDNIRPHRAALLGSGLPVFTPADAEAVQVPTQLVCGSDTPTFQYRINQRLAESIPGATNIVIKGASHLVHEDRPQVVADRIIDFCLHTD